MPVKKDVLQYGGQAVIEGVMMRSKNHFAVACRKPDGEIVIQEEPVEKSIVGKLKWMNRPFLRGTLALVDAMALGMKALTFAATVQAEALDAGEAAPTAEKAKKNAHINDIAIGATMVFAICFGMVVFIALPTLLTQFIQKALQLPLKGLLPYPQQVLMNVIDGIIRITIFLSYLWLISRLENILRVFQYHGAEHKTINTLEAGGELTLENCRLSSRIHPRCGTSFLVVVLFTSILVHCVFPRPSLYLARLAVHIALIPIVAGIAYEVIKLAGKYRKLPLVNAVLAPGLWSQRLTTREPDDSQIEVAIAALKAVIDREEGVEASAAVPFATAVV